mmetsp:Transcript_23877/g.37589  ORF Transcript_23877/g.37589 Transcript_23877/m.37589 type:complete len:622 (-) Transcript_23877:51-1916(-)
MLDLRSGGDDDQVEIGSLRLGDVGSLEGSLTTRLCRHVGVLVKVLTGEDEGGGSVLTGHTGHVSGNGLLGITGTEDIKVGDDTEARHSLNRLMGGSILTNTNGVMGQDVRHTAELGKGRNTDGGAEVINEHQEGRSGGLEDTVIRDTVEDGSHGVFTDSEVQVLACVGLIEPGAEVSSIVDVVTGGAVKIGGSRDVVGHQLGNLLNDLVTRNTGGLGVTAHLGDGGNHILSRHDVVSDSVFELLGHVSVGFLPGRIGTLPLIVDLGVLLLNSVEEVAGSLRHEPLLLREANGGTGLVNVWDTGLSVGGVGALGLFHSLSNDGVALDEFGLAIVGGLGRSDGLLDNGEVMSVNLVRLPSVGVVTLDDILGLSVLSHLVEGDLVGVVKDDQVVELLLGGEGGRLGGDSLLEASITGKGVNVVVEDRVVVGVVTGGGHFFTHGETDSVGDTSSQRTSCALNSGGGVLGVGEFGVARSLGVVLTEVLQLLDGEVESGKVEPGVKEHGSMSSGENETITVHPLRVAGVVLHLGSVKNGSNFGASKGKTHVAGVSGGDGVHGKTTRLVGGGGEGGHLVDLGGGLSHLHGSGLTDSSEGTGGRGRESLNSGGKGRTGNNKRGELHGGI